LDPFSNLSGSLPQSLASNLPLLKNLFVYGQPLAASIFPQMESNSNLEVLNVIGTFYFSQIPSYDNPFIGVFPDISKMPNLKECRLHFSQLCRYAHVPVELYPEGCKHAGELPICTEQFLELLEAARAIDPFVYAYQSVYAASKAELYSLVFDTYEADEDLADLVNRVKQKAKEDRIAREQAEEVRVAGLTAEERAVEIATEELRLANRSDAQRAAEEKAAKLNKSIGIRSFDASGLLAVFLLILLPLGAYSFVGLIAPRRRLYSLGGAYQETPAEGPHGRSE
jgi:hypothetical protein